MDMFLEADSFSILFNHRSFLGLRMGKVPLECLKNTSGEGAGLNLETTGARKSQNRSSNRTYGTDGFLESSWFIPKTMPYGLNG